MAHTEKLRAEAAELIKQADEIDIQEFMVKSGYKLGTRLKINKRLCEIVEFQNRWKRSAVAMYRWILKDGSMGRDKKQLYESDKPELVS